jgi:predicted small lipoprotein YifL
MKSKFSILLAVLALLASTLACAVGGELSLTNARMSTDSDGKNVTTTFSPTDVFYVVADLANAPTGTKVDAKWIAVDIPGEQANSVFKETNYVTDTDNFSGIVYFELSNDSGWPAGSYKVELYLNGALAQSLDFTVQ